MLRPAPPTWAASKKQDDAYRRVLWAVLRLTLQCRGGGHRRIGRRIAALQADALDFLGDAARITRSACWLSGMALALSGHGCSGEGRDDWPRLAYGLIGTVVWHALHGTLPSAFTMGTVGGRGAGSQCCVVRTALGLSSGDANMRSRVDLHPKTMSSAIWRFALPRLASLALALDGLISSWRQSWLHWPYKERRS